jgi:hypothetical protein
LSICLGRNTGVSIEHFAMSVKHCLVCNGTLEQGFVIDHTYGSRLQQQWSAGTPERSFWFGVHEPERSHKISAYRCTQCGFVMEFAVEAKESQ